MSPTHPLALRPLVLSCAWALSLASCATNTKDPFPSDEIPKSPRVAALDPAYVLADQAKTANQTEYRQALSRSQGFIFNLRVMPITDAYAKVILQKPTPDPTCFRMEYDTYDKPSAEVANWEVEFISDSGEKTPLTMTIDPDTIAGIEKVRSLQIRATLCAKTRLSFLPAFKMSFLRKYEKKPEAEVFEWTAWKPGISISPTRVRW
jgi:hypothetical protein